MKVRIAKRIDLIDLPDDFATLEDFTRDGFFVYKIKYLANPSKILKEKITVAKIRFLEDKPRPKNPRIFDQGFSASRIISNLKFWRATQKDLNRQKKNFIIKEFNSDITKKISNTQTGELAKMDMTESPSIQVPSSIETLPIEEIENRNILAPILETNLYRDNEQQLSQNQAMENSLSLILNDRIDPATFVGEKSNTILPAKKALQGFGPNSSGTNRDLSRSPGRRQRLRNALLKSKDIQNQKSLSKKQAINIVTKRTQTFVTIEETLYIPAGDLNFDNFILEIEVTNEKKQQSLQKIKNRVTHQEKILNLFTPILAPKLVVSPIGSKGRNLLTVAQKDKYASGIGIYRRIIPLDEVDTDSGYTHLTDINLMDEEGPELIEDRISTANPVIYRAIPFNIDGVLGGEFTSQVTVGSFTPRDRKKIKRRPAFVTLSHEIDYNSIRFFVNNIAPEVVALELQRKDLTKRQQDYSRVEDIILLKPRPIGQLEFEDKNVKDFRIYEYRCKLFYRDGNTEIANNNLIIEYSPLQSNILNIGITLPVVSQDEKGIDVTFDISKDVILKDMDIIKAFLEDQGIDAEFEDEVTANKEKLQSLFFIQVLRFNLASGEIEDFGIIDNMSFSDEKFGRVKNVTPLQAGINYKYAIIAYARDPETLFPTSSREVTKKNITYTLEPHKWLHPVTLTEGNIVSESTLKRNHAKTTFTLGKIVDIKYAEVDLRTSFPSITTAKAEPHRKNSVLLKWKIQGDATKIDHFIIVLETLGLHTIVGKAHSISSTNEFLFVDLLSNGESGLLKYIIIPVYFDYSRGAEVYTNQIII